MGITIPTAVRNALIDACVDRVDAGAGFGTITVRTIPRPAATAAATGTLLLILTLPKPSFDAGGTAGPGIATLDTTPAISAVGAGAGDAAWFRVADSAGTTVFDGSVTATGGTGDLTLDTITVSVGLTVTVTSGTMTMPAGTP
jgi:hypothetical protein